MTGPARIGAGPSVILCADDYAISEAVSSGIEELALAGRLSATSAMVTFPEWPRLAGRLAALRGRIAIGLHLNLTVGAPLGAMPNLAPAGTLPSVGQLSLAALRGGVDAAEIAAEVRRQLDRFSQHAQFPPDFVDGHQHAHALPAIRRGVLDGLAGVAQTACMLIRDPSDQLPRIVRRGVCVAKATQVAMLAMGFGNAARDAGFPVNAGFSGFSQFDPSSPYERELEAGFMASGPRHVMMCHPGRVDGVLASRDGVTVRREQELAAIMAAQGLSERLWRPDRSRPNIWDTAP